MSFGNAQQQVQPGLFAAKDAANPAPQTQNSLFGGDQSATTATKLAQPEANTIKAQPGNASSSLFPAVNPAPTSGGLELGAVNMNGAKSAAVTRTQA